MTIDIAKNLRDAEIYEAVLNAGGPNPLYAAANAIEPDGAEMGRSVWKALAELYTRGSWDNLGPDDQRNVSVFLARTDEMALRIRCPEVVLDWPRRTARDASAKG